MATSAEKSGIINADEFAQRYPALSTKLAINTAQDTGLDVSDPTNIVTAMQSQTFQQQASQASQVNDRGSLDSLINRPSKLAPTSASQEDQTNAAFDEAEASRMDTIQAKGSALKKLSAAEEKLATLSDFNAESYRKQRMKELDPVSDIDARMLELRMQAFTAEALLNSDPEILKLSPAQQERVIASRMQVFGNLISQYKQTRDLRLSQAEEQIREEVGATESQINKATQRISAIDREISYIEDIGGDREALADLRVERLKEMERLKKSRGKAGGMTTQKELVYNALIQDFKASHGDRLPDSTEEKELRRQVEYILSNDPSTASDTITGRKVPVQTTKQVDLPGDGAITGTAKGLLRLLTPKALEDNLGLSPAGGTTDVNTTEYVDAIRAGGYGIPLSQEENIQLRLDRAKLENEQSK